MILSEPRDWVVDNKAYKIGTMTDTRDSSKSRLSAYIGPNEIVFITAFPVDAHDFSRALTTGEFCSYFALGWSQYEDEVAIYLHHLFGALRDLGVHCESFVTNDRFGELLHNPWKLICLLTYFNEKTRCLEFSDGMHTTQSVVTRFPPLARFIFDCVACQSESIREEVRKFAPYVVVTEFTLDLSPTPWIMFYEILIRTIIKTKTSYFWAHIAARAYIEQQSRQENDP
jgi:hypothetical protein